MATLGNMNRALRALDRRIAIAESANRADIALRLLKQIKAAEQAAKAGQAAKAYQILCG